MAHPVCDAPVKVFMKCVKGHTGYYGCNKCEVEGKSNAVFG